MDVPFISVKQFHPAQAVVNADMLLSRLVDVGFLLLELLQYLRADAAAGIHDGDMQVYFSFLRFQTFQFLLSILVLLDESLVSSSQGCFQGYR